MLHSPFAQPSQDIAAWIPHERQIGCIDLCVAIETTESLVYCGRIQEHGQTMGECLRQAARFLVEDIQVLLRP